MRLDRNTIHRDNIGLGLQKTPDAFVNAKLREESIKTIPPHSRQTTALSLSKRTNSICAKKQYAMQESNAPLLDNKAK
jgi:hypothetical protein